MDAFSLYSSVIRYLERDSFLSRVKSRLIKTLCEKRRPVSIVPIHLRLHELVEFLGSSVIEMINRVSTLEKMLQKIIFCLAIEADILCEDDDMNYILLELKFTDILCIPELHFKNVSLTFDRLTFIEGVVIGITPIYMTTNAIIYSCQDSLCPGKNAFLVQHETCMPKVRNKPRCKYCNKEGKEEIEKRSFSETVEFLLLPRQDKETGTILDRFRVKRSIRCFVLGKLIHKLSFGRRCFVSGVPFLNKAGQSYQWQFKVYGIVDITVNPIDPWKCALSTVVKSLPSYVPAYEFGIAFTFAFMFLDNITKPGTFFLLKWLLLLLLTQNEFTEPSNEGTSFSRSSSRPPALLLLGSLGDSISNKILRTAGQYAKPFCEHKSSGSLLPTSLEMDSTGSKKPNMKCLKKTAQQKNTKTIELDKTCSNGGTIELASGGIAFFPNLELYKKKELTNLIYALENMAVSTSFVQHENKSPSNREITDELPYPNETTIWATAEITSAYREKLKKPTFKFSQTDLFDTEPSTQATTATKWTCSSLLRKGNLKRITHAFDLVIYTEEVAGPMELMDESLSDLCLTMADKSSLEEYSSRLPSHSYMRIYTSLLDACKNSPPVKIEDDASQLLKVYYLAMRRSSVGDQQTAPASALPTLFKLAKANAKINGRIVATEVDSTIAIYIYDTFIEFQTGTSYLGLKPLHYVSGMEQTSMEELNSTLISINKQLKDLINVAMDEL
uniref:MCM domain-containing protein n=1 Tax=Trichobilharzia regenti TaxID=157069 RepID=A0AA85JWU9_TRIRE|nr:unnamed protein product [Trichobilharzia regenti]